MPEPSYKRKEPIVKIQKLIVLPLSLALIVLPLSACGTSSASSAGSTGGAESAAASTATTDFAGTYTYTTTIEQESVYGPVEKDVVAFEIELAEDGTATLTVGDEAGTYTDDSGTWEATSDTDATVTLANRSTRDLRSLCLSADILIAAAGSPGAWRQAIWAESPF